MIELKTTQKDVGKVEGILRESEGTRIKPVKLYNYQTKNCNISQKLSVTNTWHDMCTYLVSKILPQIFIYAKEGGVLYGKEHDKNGRE